MLPSSPLSSAQCPEFIALPRFSWSGKGSYGCAASAEPPATESCAHQELAGFARIIAHDLKTPLRGIATLADWLAIGQGERLDAEGREHLELLIRRVRRLDAFVDGLMLWAQADRDQPAEVPVDFNGLVREVVEDLLPPSGIDIVVGNLPTLSIQAALVRQIFQNLIDNAIRFMDKPYGRIEINSLAEAGFWTFAVIDNGPGIDPLHFERIFALFQTLHPRDRLESTGIGLAVVKKIVEGYGGRVWVESTPGRGSAFLFTLPE